MNGGDDWWPTTWSGELMTANIVANFAVEYADVAVEAAVAAAVSDDTVAI